MTREYTFETRAGDGGSAVVAAPASDDAERVELESAWLTDGDVEGEWERAVYAVLDAELFESFAVGDGVARVEQSTAVEALVELLEDIGDEAQADALVAYLADADVWTLDGEDVVVLKDPRDATLSGREALSWALALDVCIARIDEFVDELETRADRVKTLDAERDRFEARLHAVTTEMRALGRGSKFPEDPSALDEAAGERYAALRTLLGDLVRTETDPRGLGADRNVLMSTREELCTRASQVRTHAIEGRAFPDDAISVPNRLDRVVSTLASEDVIGVVELLEETRMTSGSAGKSTKAAGVGTVKEAVETTSDEELAKMVEEDLPNLELEQTDMPELAEECTEEDADDGGTDDD
ncbi:hypothetical protein [Halorubellus litoreus]|uniref:Uncharacterized protein n=1 Tax=Halorubellus litoreus TaxID=755308 RepID=A0ABD5VME0_9EURY